MEVLDLSGDFFVPILIFAVPIVAIVGGITAGIVRMLVRARIAELAARERIAAIERGVDLSKLPPPPDIPLSRWEEVAGTQYNPLRRAQGLMVGGIVTLSVGIGLAVFLHYVADEPGVWAVGVIPGAVGFALLLSAALLWPRGGNGMQPPGPPR